MPGLFDNNAPRHLPHLAQPGVLNMGLYPLGNAPWIETDSDFPRYLDHKIRQRERLGEGVYRALPCSHAAQRELAELLLSHLLDEQGSIYQLRNDKLLYKPASKMLSPCGEEPLWDSSLWIADDLVIMQEIDGAHRLSAASLCSPSDWLLEEKFGRSLANIHADIPGFTNSLTPKVERFFKHLKDTHPVVRYNWSLQEDDNLCRRLACDQQVKTNTPLYYRTERQSLRRLPASGAVVFTIRVYLNPLETLRAISGALPALLRAVDDTPEALAAYKGFDRLAPALQQYRES